MKVVTYLVLSFKIISNLQQLKMFFNGLFKLFLAYKDIEPSYGRMRTRGFSQLLEKKLNI